MPEELAEAIREEQVRLDLLDELSAELEAELGPIPDEIRQQTRQTWPNYPGA